MYASKLIAVSGWIFCVIGIVLVVFGGQNSKTDAREKNNNKEPSKLLVIWTSSDKDVAEKMVFMYTYNAKKNGWWDEVRFIIWGPSSKLLSNDNDLQNYLAKMKETGVELLACKACADMYDVTEKLEKMGVDVKYMGVPLTDMLKSGWVTMTF